ncbi:hypothetical protein [Spirosoma litoris]
MNPFSFSGLLKLVIAKLTPIAGDKIIASELREVLNAIINSIAAYLTKLQALVDVKNLNSTPKGPWNALTNSPALTTSASADGDYYDVIVAGTSSITGTPTDFKPGDQAKAKGGVWYRIPSYQVVPSTRELSSLNVSPRWLGEVATLGEQSYRAVAADPIVWLPERSAGFPFTDNSTGIYTGVQLSINTMRQFIIDLQLNNTDPNKLYSVVDIARNKLTDGTPVWRIGIWSSALDGTGQAFECWFVTTVSPEVGDSITLHDLTPTTGTITGKIAVNWSRLTDATSWFGMWNDQGYKLVPEVFGRLPRWGYLKALEFKTLKDDYTTSKPSFLVGLADGALPGAYLPTIQYKHSRGDSEYAGNGQYGFSGFAVYEQMTTRVIMQKISVNIFGAADSVGQVRVYRSSQVWNGNFAQAGFNLIQTFNLGAGDWNDNTKFLSVTLTNPLLILPGEYITLVAFKTAGTLISYNKWSTQAGSAPLRHAFLCTLDANPASATWTTTTVDYGTPLIIERLDDSANKFRPRLTVPSNIYAMVGKELCLYFDAMIYAPDAGLKSPDGCTVEVFCTKGRSDQRRWSFTPVSGDVGTAPITIRVLDLGGNVLEKITRNLVIVAASNPATAKNATFLADSTMHVPVLPTTIQANLAALPGVVPTFRGLRGTAPAKTEARGGYSYILYATYWTVWYRANISAGNVVEGDVYQAPNGIQIKIEEAYVSLGFLRTSPVVFGSSAPNSGIWTKISGTGDATLTISSIVNASQNPFWNPATGAVDIAYWRGLLGMGSTKIQVARLSLGINDCNQPLMTEAMHQTNIGYIKTIANTFLADNAACKVIVELPTSSPSTAGGWGATFGATFSKEDFRLNIHRFRELILSNFDNGVYNANVVVGGAALGVDRYWGYDRTNLSAGPRYAGITEEQHTDVAHPTVFGGYQQWADMATPQLIAVLN